MTVLGKRVELKNWMPEQSKKKIGNRSVGVQFRASGDLHKSEKPGWSASDIGVTKKVAQTSSFPQGRFAKTKGQKEPSKKQPSKEQLSKKQSSKKYPSKKQPSKKQPSQE